MNTPAEQLSVEEFSRLSDCEHEISCGLKQFVAVGNALLKIRDERLYRQDYKSFESYCLQKWGWSYKRSNQYIASANVAKTLTTNGSQSVPANERQARELAALPEDKQLEAWSSAQEKAASESRPVTASDVKEAVEQVKPSKDKELVSAMGGIRSIEEFEEGAPKKIAPEIMFKEFQSFLKTLSATGYSETQIDWLFNHMEAALRHWRKPTQKAA